MAAAELVAKPLRKWYVREEPVRRVEKTELADWLRRIGEESMMDDMDDESHVDALWEDMRCRNSRLIASLTKERLEEANYVAGEIDVILEYVIVEVQEPPPGPHTNVTITMQPDPNADARSQAQLDAFSDTIKTTVRQAATDRADSDPFLSGENRRATVKETRALLLKLRHKAAKFDSRLGEVFMQLYYDLDGAVGLLDVDKEMFQYVYKSLTPSQHARYGGGVTDSGTMLAQSIFKGAVDMDHSVFIDLCSKLNALGRTALEHAVPERLKQFEERVLEVRFSKTIKLDTAVEMLAKIMAPMAEQVPILMVEWMTGAKDQQAFDKLLTSASIKSETAAGSTSTKTTPNKVPSNERANGPSGSGWNRNRWSRPSGSGQNGQQPWRTQNQQFAQQNIPPVNQTQLRPQWHLAQTVANQPRQQWQGGWRNSNRQQPPVTARVNAVTVQELEQMMCDRDAENAELRHQMQELQCNFMQLQCEAGLISPVELEGTERSLPELKVNGMGVSKVVNRKRERAPTLMQKLKQTQQKSDAGSPTVVSALIDSCTDTSVACENDLKHCSNSRQCTPVNIVSVTGKSVNDRKVDMPTVIGGVGSRVLPKAQKSIIAQVDILEKGYGVVTLPGVGCGLVDINKPLGHPERVIECPPEGNMYRMPTTCTPAARAVEMQRAERILRRWVQRRRLKQSLEHAKTHTPADMVDCDGCKMAGITKAPSERKEPHRYRKEAEQKFDGLDFTFDYITGLPPDNDGNIAAFHMEEAQHELGSVVPCKTRSEDEALASFHEAMADILSRLPLEKRVVRSVHSDNEKASVFGKLMHFIREKHWHKTLTEPYDHNGNARLEGRNRRLKRVWRAFLMTATG